MWLEKQKKGSTIIYTKYSSDTVQRELWLSALLQQVT